ncbi:CbiQ family ECF transporter T component [[Mycobacterium] wendilense]|uniref:CbiQ family ECF transporter T component n=1 Tax=[Mycobacterium] wendilense TaxID=3064284 RepID=A0ABN9NTH4_9MYCO|nr:CbiQ family ECF transporter T component [Mycolicibacterium sp. MU0050]CAJ1579167.1 CbiQ family ECF transporter T component [Mycolicibacterium sp. MU0050]
MNPLEVSAAQNRWSTDPAAEKVCLYGGLLLCAMLLPPRTGAPLVLLATAVATLGLARVRPRLFVLALLGPAVFIAIGSLPIAVSLRGGPHLEPGGVEIAVNTALRSIAASAATIGLAMTTSMADLLDLARRAGMPAALCHVADLTFRLVGILVRSARTAREAVTLRLGLRDPRGAIVVIGAQSALIFVRATGRARAMSEAMSLRAEPGMTAVLTADRPVRPARLAVIAAALTVVAVAAVASWRAWQGV